MPVHSTGPRRNHAYALALLGLVLASSIAQAADYAYRVQPGDTVIGISERRLVDPSLWRKVARYNRLRNPDYIRPGQDLNIPLEWLKLETTSAEIVELSGRASVSAKGTPVPVQRGSRIAPGAEIATADDGFVTLRLADGSGVRIKSNTQMRVDTLSRVPDTDQHQSVLRLILGRLEVIAQKLRGPATRFSIETPVGSTSVRGTDFRVAGSGEKFVQHTEVLDGRVAVAAQKSATEETAVDAGFGTTVDAAGGVAQPVALLAAPAVSQLPALQERPLVRFRLDPLERAVAYRGQIGRTAAFVTPVAEIVSASPELRFEGLPDGDYVLRARAVDSRGLEGRDAEHPFRLKARPEPPIPSTPPQNAKLRGVSVNFSWSENQQAARYLFQLARDPGFASVVREIPGMTATRHTEAGPLAPGTYYWRVASVRAGGDRGPFGDTRTFALLPPPAQPEPPQIGDDEVTFSWSGEPGQRFEFELARDERFTSELAQHKLGEPRIALPRPAPGIWYIRYRAIDSDGYVGPYTSPQRFTVPPCIVGSGGRCIGIGSGGVLAPN
ncbi:MAG TPA: FecR domain-containing protein [Burkholderiales bacterium]|nr:FecR domain-containing protein [Burkholderiales bacterium]